MRYKWLGVSAVAAVAIAIVFSKQGPEIPRAADTVKPEKEASPSVLLFADPHEADEVGGCGEIFSLVRAAAARGVSTLEVDPQSDSELIREHRVTVSPTVILLDETGAEIRRHEGEDAQTLAAIEADLEHRATGVAAQTQRVAKFEGQALPSVLLFADPDEAGQSCGCGRIISLVRAAAAQGIPTVEVDPEGDSELIREHRVVVSPTVILVDEFGTEIRRHEGEDAQTIAAIEVDLEQLAVESVEQPG